MNSFIRRSRQISDSPSASASRPIEFLAKVDKSRADKVSARIAKIGRKVSEITYLPMQTRAGIGFALLDAKTGDLVELSMEP